MKKKIEDYFFLYMGCDLQVKNPFGKIETLTSGSYEQFRDAMETNSKPILRKWIYVTEEEQNDVREIKRIGDTATTRAEEVRYYLSKGIDIFMLIEAGLAIDSSTYEKHNPAPTDSHS